MLRLLLGRKSHDYTPARRAKCKPGKCACDVWRLKRDTNNMELPLCEHEPEDVLIEVVTHGHGRSEAPVPKLPHQRASWGAQPKDAELAEKTRAKLAEISAAA